jgi:hypothetical protein
MIASTVRQIFAAKLRKSAPRIAKAELFPDAQFIHIVRDNHFCGQVGKIPPRWSSRNVRYRLISLQGLAGHARTIAQIVEEACLVSVPLPQTTCFYIGGLQDDEDDRALRWKCRECGYIPHRFHPPVI